MKIDKTRFLMLTTTLAATAVAALVVSATGCNTVVTDTDAGNNTNPGTDSGSTSDGSTADGSSNADASDGALACLGNGGSAPLCGPAGDAGDGDAGDAGGISKCTAECDKFNANFKTDVAKSVSDCMDKAIELPTTEGCAGAAPECVTAALANSCDDATATTFCTELVADCADAGDTVTQQDCATLVKALSDQGRTTLKSCISEGVGTGCLPGTVTACFDAAKSPF